MVPGDILDQQISASQGPERRQDAYQPDHTDERTVMFCAEGSGNDGEVRRLNHELEP